MAQHLHSSSGGKIHEHKLAIAMAALQFQELPHGQCFADGWIGRPPGSECFHAFPDHSVSTQAGVMGCNQHRGSSHLSKPQGAVDEVGRRHLLASAETDSPGLKKIGVTAEAFSFSAVAEASP